MTLREAIKRAKDIGGYVVYGDPSATPDYRWTEYTVQHDWAGDVLRWQAGGTVGGCIDQPWESSPRFGDNLDREGFHVYAEWGDKQPIA